MSTPTNHGRTGGGKRVRHCLRSMRRRWLPLVAIAGVAATTVLPIAAQPALALPSTHEMTANWYGTPTPTEAPYGAAITSEWHINTNDDDDPYTNEPVDNVRATLTVNNGVFVSIPSVCKTTGVEPVSAITDNSTTLLCNLGTIREGTATVIQAPVRVSGFGVDLELTASGEVTSDEAVAPATASPDPLPITYIRSMDLSLAQAPGQGYQGAVKQSRTGGDRTFVQMNFSLILAEGSMPGPADYSFPLSVSSAIPGALTGFQWEGCVPVGASSRSTGQPYSDPAQPDRTNFPGCTVSGSGTNYMVTLTGLTYDLINTPTNDSLGEPLPGTGAYIASGTVQFSIPDPVQVLTDYNFIAAPPPFTFVDGQSAPDANAANNFSSATLIPPGRFSNHWAGTPANSRSPWDANLFVSPGTSQDVQLPFPGIETRADWNNYVASNPAPPLPLYMQVNSRLWEDYDGAPGTALAGVCTMSQNPDFIITHIDGGGWWGGLGIGDNGTPYENYETARYYYTTAAIDTKTETCGQAPGHPMWTEVFPEPGSHLDDPRIGWDSLIDLEAMGITGVTGIKMTWDPAVDRSALSFLRGFGYIDPTAPTTGEGWTIGTANGPNGNPWPGYPTLNGWGNASTAPGGVPIPGSTYGPNTNGIRDAFRLQGATGIITKTTPQTTAEPGVPITYTLTAEAELALTAPPNQTFPVIDTLPEGLVYVDGSAEPEPTSVSADGRTIRWDFVNVPANQTFTITYQAVRPLDDVRAPGAALTNVAEIQVPGDQRPVESKRARETVVVPSSSSTNFLKTLEDQMLNYYGDDSAWLLTLRSEDPINNGFTDTIDILPYLGDPGGTNIGGTYTVDVAGITAPPGSTIYYTTVDPATLSLDPRDATNGATPGTVPAGTPAGWTTTPPATNPTAIRVIGPALEPGATQQIRIPFTTPEGTDCLDLDPVTAENRPDQVMWNSAGSFAGHTALPMYSSQVATIAGCVVFDKEFESLTRLADGTYDVRYTLTATGEGNAILPYDLIDDMQYGDAITINELPAPPTATNTAPGTIPLLNTWDPVATTLVVANDVPILDEAVHEYSVLVNVSVDGEEVTWENTNCAEDANEGENTGLHNTATLSNPDVTIPDEACPEVPYVEHEKNVLSGPTPIGNGLYEVKYQIDVRNLGAGSTMYDLTDDFQFGEAVTIVGTPTVEHINPDPDVIPTLGTFDPAATTIAIVDNQPIAGSTVDAPEVHSYVVTVQVSVDAPLVTFENTDCDLGGDSGTGLHNESTLTVDEHVTEDQACVPISEPVHTKTVSAGPTPLGNGTYEVEYTIEVANHGAADTVYDLVDDFKFGSSVTIEGTPTVANTVPGGIATLGTWDPATTTLSIVDGEPILAASVPPDSEPVVHEYVVTVIVSVDAPSLTVANSDCTMDPGESGTGLFNAATMTVNGEPVDRNACPPISEPSHVKTIASGPTPMGNNTYEVKYAITVTNPGAAEGVYDLVDDFKFGSSVTIQGTPTVTNTVPGGIATLGTWDPVATTLAIVDDQPIVAGTPAGAAVHEYIVTVLVSLDPATSTLENTDCNLDANGGSGLFNTATMTVNGETADRDACAELPHFVIQKGIASGPNALGDNTYTLDYVITVTNDGAGAGLYDLTDTLTYGSNVTVISTVISGTGPAGIPTNPGWNGRSDVNVSSGINLAAGGVHTYQVRVTFSVPVGASGGANDCTLEAGETGTGLLNNATVNNNGNQQAAAACALVAPPPPPPPAPPPTTVPPPQPDTGELPATGGNSTPIGQTAALLVAAGLLVMFATRKRRRSSAS